MKYQNCAAVAQAPDEPLELDVGLRLSDANINPSTGLATDYLNRFNEAVMLLDMLATCPEFRDDFLSWESMSYREHFRASHSRTRDLALSMDFALFTVFTSNFPRIYVLEYRVPFLAGPCSDPGGANSRWLRSQEAAQG